MAIAEDSLIEFFGTADALGNTTSSIANNVLSDGSNDLNEWTNDDDAPDAMAVIKIDTTSARTIDTVIGLYCSLKNMVGQAAYDEEPVTTANLTHFLGNFPMRGASGVQYVGIPIELLNTQSSQVYQFYIYNQSGQTILASWELYIGPKTVGPHPA